MRNRRKIKDRRANNHQQDKLFGCNRRYRADRRLNNIEVEWISIENIRMHPTTRLIFSRD